MLTSVNSVQELERSQAGGLVLVPSHVIWLSKHSTALDGGPLAWQALAVGGRMSRHRQQSADKRVIPTVILCETGPFLWRLDGGPFEASQPALLSLARPLLSSLGGWLHA